MEIGQHTRGDLLRRGKNELIEMCLLEGHRAHRGMGKDALVDCILDSIPPTDDPVDEMRVEVMQFIEGHDDELILGCHKNCYEHSAVRVAHCWIKLKSKEKI